MINKPRGTRDFLPEDMDKRIHLEDKIKKSFEKYGFRQIETPIFENLELFTAKSGEGIIGELYDFEDKSGRKLSLRPELTAPVIRSYVEKLQMEPKPIKLFYFGNCYRYDRPQKGRYREFKQAGCEIIGTDKPEAISELISLAYNILRESGLKNFILNIGNLDLLSYFFKELNLSNDQIKDILPLIDKSDFEILFETLLGFNISKDQINRFIEILRSDKSGEILDLIKSNELEFIKNNFEETLKLLKNNYKIPYNFKLGIVRGLDYYKGTVFEIEAPSLGAEKQICGGGSYELIHIFEGKDTPTSGFALGFDRILLVLENENYNFPSKFLDAYIIPINYDMMEKSIEILNILRENNIRSDIDLLRRGIGKSLKYASSLNVKKSIIIGPKDIQNDSVTVRDMKTGFQKSIKIGDVIKFIQKN